MASSNPRNLIISVGILHITGYESLTQVDEMIITQELVRVGARGYGDGIYHMILLLHASTHLATGMLGGLVIGLPPVSTTTY